MTTMASQITSVSIVCTTVWSGADKRKHQSSASLAFVRGIHRWSMNSPHKGPVTWTMFPFDDDIMYYILASSLYGKAFITVYRGTQMLATCLSLNHNFVCSAAKYTLHRYWYMSMCVYMCANVYVCECRLYTCIFVRRRKSSPYITRIAPSLFYRALYYIYDHTIDSYLVYMHAHVHVCTCIYVHKYILIRVYICICVRV